MSSHSNSPLFESCRLEATSPLTSGRPILQNWRSPTRTAAQKPNANFSFRQAFQFSHAPDSRLLLPMERGDRFEIIGIGATCFVTATDDPTVVRKGYQVWEDGRLAVNREHEYYESGEEDVQREAAVYKLLGDHPHILKFLALEEVGPGVHSLRLERAPLNNLRRYIGQRPEEPPTPEVRLRMTLEAARAIAHIHSKGAQHCDLSCRNLLLFAGLPVKLGDFGASLIDGRGFDETHYEEASYELPLRGREFHARPGRKRDLFALGSAIYEITTWKRPWQGLEDEEIESRYAREEFPPLDGNVAGSIISKCWKEVYETADEVVTDLNQCFESLGKESWPALPCVLEADSMDAKPSANEAIIS
ncbi:kinase-like domain-containing protein [Diplogelasinospora grovesii]|uniref:Kinase-like domain-containing protein n=1 Tax=Diplogelasinospora grovesii TaxID=303347 RepID=A0AAN6S0L6_9PEZI|nr:kinase-like domain-containing protein [Diplogelasinospora grovesii]